MPTITRENIAPLTDKITVELAREDYYPFFEKELKQLGRTATMPGFRKGMVPAGVIRKMYGGSVFSQEVLKAMEKGLVGYLKDEQLDLLGQPLALEDEFPILDPDQAGALRFPFEVGLKPPVELTPLKDNFAFTRYRVRVEDALIDADVEDLRRKHGEKKEKEAVSDESDILQLRFQAADAEGKPLEEGPEREEKVVLNYFEPATRAQLQGAKAGDSLLVKMGEAFGDKELEWLSQQWKLDEPPAAADRYFQLTLLGVEEIIPRALEKAFFEEAYPGQGLETEEDLRRHIRENHEAYWLHQANHRLDDEIFERLVHETPLELPVDFLKRWLARDQGEGKALSEEEVEARYPGFDHQLRWNLITDKLIADNGISVGNEELRDHAKNQLLSYFGGAPSEAMLPVLEQYAEKMMSDEKFLNNAYQQLITAKVFAWLREQASITEQEVSEEEFNQLPHNHHHHAHE